MADIDWRTEEFERLVVNENLVQHPLGGKERARRWPKRLRLVLLVLVAGALSFILGVGFVFGCAWFLLYMM